MSTVDERAELRADIAAVAGPAGGDEAAYAMQTHPAILRRVAALLAEELPAALDRVVAAEPVATPLATAVALHTGLPFALADLGETGAVTWHGELRAGETVAVLDLTLATAHRIAQAVHARHAEVTGLYSVLGKENPAAALVLFPGEGTHAC